MPVGVSLRTNRDEGTTDVAMTPNPSLFPPPTHTGTSYISLPRSLEEEPHHKNLQTSHTDHHHTLHNTEVEYPSLRTPHGTEIPILSCAEVLLVPGDRRQLAR